MERKVMLFFLLGLSIAGIPLVAQNYILSTNISKVKNDMSLKEQEISNLEEVLEELMNSISLKEQEISNINEVLEGLTNNMSLKEEEISKLKEVQNILLNRSAVSWSENTSSPNKYVFIEHSVHTHIEIIEGTYHYELIDSPTYSFNNETGILRGIINFDVNDTLKVVFGSGRSVSGIGGGRDSMLYGVYELPYQHYGFTMLFLEADGTIHLIYQDMLITLRVGEEWIKTSSKTDTYISGEEKNTVNLTITDRIINRGILSKVKIERG